MDPKPPVRDLRQYARSSSIRFVIGFVAVLLVIGLGLIAWIYGWGAMGFGLLCLLGMLVPAVVIGLTVEGMGWIVKRARRDE